MRTLLGGHHIHGNINPLPARADDDAIHRRDIGIVASDREHHVPVGDNNRRPRPRSPEIMMCAKSWQTPRRNANDIGGVVATVVAPIS